MTVFDEMLVQSHQIVDYLATTGEGGGNENIACSVQNLFFALVLLQLGANGNSLDQLNRFLGATLTDRAAFDANVKTVVDYLGTKRNSEKLSQIIIAANKIYTDQGSGGDISSDYLNSCRELMNAQVQPIDLSDTTNSAKTINSWVSETTFGKIDHFLTASDLSKDAKLVLLSVLYFKYNWMYPFDKSETTVDSFYLPDQTKVTVDFMYKELRVHLLKTNQFKMIALPYESTEKNSSPDLYAVLVIGNNEHKMEDLIKYKKVNFESYLNRLFDLKNRDNYEANSTSDGQTDDSWQSSFEKVQVKIPKFKVTTKINLNHYLSTVGKLGDLFDRKLANLSKMTTPQAPTSFFVSSILQSVVIEINEIGTEAAASTAIQIEPMCMNPFEPEKFTADKPFLFYIHNNRLGVPIFTSYIRNPATASAETKSN